MREYAEGLRKDEKSSQTITKYLFKRYTKMDVKSKWGDWLERHQNNESQLIQRCKEDNEQRTRLMAKRKARKQEVACLIEIELKFTDAADKLSTFHSIEMKKALVSLRKAVLEAYVEKGGNKGDNKLLVTKEVFDLHMADVLAPQMMKLNPEVRGLAEEARRSHEGLGIAASIGISGVESPVLNTLVDYLFSQEKSNAVEKAMTIRSDTAVKAEVDFNEWKIRKAQEKEKAFNMTKTKLEIDEQAKKKREKIAQKTYKQWCKLRKTGKYISRVDKKVHTLPASQRVDHDGRWSKDVEVVHPQISYL